MNVEKSTLDFLRLLEVNNNREWFHANEAAYKPVKASHELLIAKLIEGFSSFENMDGVAVKNCNYRIARDVRFSKDKSPYKSWLSASLMEGGRKSTNHDYYLHIQPNNQSFMGGGMFGPTNEQLAKFRQEIDYNPNEIKSIIYDPTFVKYFSNPIGASLKTSPKGYEKTHPDIELLRMNQLYFTISFTDNQILSNDFTDKVVEASKILKTYLDYLNQLFAA